MKQSGRPLDVSDSQFEIKADRIRHIGKEYSPAATAKNLSCQQSNLMAEDFDIITSVLENPDYGEWVQFGTNGKPSPKGTPDFNHDKKIGDKYVVRVEFTGPVTREGRDGEPHGGAEREYGRRLKPALAGDLSCLCLFIEGHWLPRHVPHPC